MDDLKKLQRYRTKRPNHSGRDRWYWQRPGHPLTRLPDDLVEQMAMLRQLNATADAARQTDQTRAPERYSIGWMIAEYRREDYPRLSANSQKIYKRFLNDIEALGPTLPFASFTRRAVIDYIQSYPHNSQRRTAGTVLKNLFRLAKYHGIVTVDQAAELRLRTDPPRDRIWSDDEKARWLVAASSVPWLVTAFRLLEFTAQRPIDILKMTRAQISDNVIRLRQQKTGALLDIPLHPILRDHLAEITSMMLVTHRGRTVSYRNFNRGFQRISKLAGIDAQARDLRRTAMINMALAGATVPQIASVSGHSIDRCSRILETYLPRGRELAQAAITKLSEYRK
jgi:hypothetical protein